MNRYVYKDLNRLSLQAMMIEHQFILEAGDDRWLDALINFLHTIIYKVDINDCDEDLYVNLHSDILGEIYGQRKNSTGVYYRRVIHILYEIGVIEINHAYEEGVISKGYRINAKYGGSIVEETINPESINKKVDTLSTTASRHENNIISLSFDTLKANEIIKRLHLAKRLSLTTWAFRLSSKIGLTVTEDKNGRIYSALTGLNKEFRQCLSYRGQDLYAVDLKQAHPYLFIYLLTQRIKQNSKVDLQAYLGSGNHADVGRYIYDVCSNNFIENVHAQVIKNKKHITSGEIKMGILIEVFYQRIKKNKHMVAKAFSDLYPTVWNAVQALKKKDHKELANKLMKLESRLMNSVTNQLHKTHPDKLFLRLHDAVVTTVEMIQSTEDIINKIGFEIIGYSPMLTSSQLNVADGELAHHDLSVAELLDTFTKYHIIKYEKFIGQLDIKFHMKKITVDEYEDKKQKFHDEFNIVNIKKWIQKSMLIKF